MNRTTGVVQLAGTVPEGVVRDIRGALKLCDSARVTLESDVCSLLNRIGDVLGPELPAKQPPRGKDSRTSTLGQEIAGITFGIELISDRIQEAFERLELP